MKVFISAELTSKRPIENQTRTTALHALLQARGFNFVDCLGVYQGHKELSFCVTAKSSNDLVKLHNIANMFGQACILVVNAENCKCYLVFSNGSRQDVGTKFVEVNKDDLKGDYTKIDDKYYKVK
jgi:hypothetical protein